MGSSPATRPRPCESGQALTEYGILLALTSSLTWIQHATEGFDMRIAVGVLLAGLVLAVVLSGRR